jgi:pimeloyl-ACP methyl ester carboxylesterase
VDRSTASRSKTIVFIHGLFLNPESWNPWIARFAEKGFSCHAPAYPFHSGAPSALRERPDPRLGRLAFDHVLDEIARFVDGLPERPILVGHSMGGLVVQKLISMGKGSAGVCIGSVAPAGVLVFDWQGFKLVGSVVNPFKGNQIFHCSPEWFHRAFCNTMTQSGSAVAYEALVVPESRNILRTSIGKHGKIDLSRPHAPLLFIAGDRDVLVPAALTRKNFLAYRDPSSRRDIQVFSGRSHHICGQVGWEQVAESVERWVASLDTLPA